MRPVKPLVIRKSGLQPGISAGRTRAMLAARAPHGRAYCGRTPGCSCPPVKAYA